MVKVLRIAVVLAPVVACGVHSPSVQSGIDTTFPSHTGQCPRGIAAIETDYQSTNVSLWSPKVEPARPSFISSGSHAPGASAALSGDVVLPSEPPRSGKVVLIDRYPNSTITWLDANGGNVEAQLSVATGFASNPHDYIEVDAHRAYVSRFESNSAAGRVPFDSGGDVLIVDTDKHAIVGNIPLATSSDGQYQPRADRFVRFGRRIGIGLQRLNASFTQAENSMFVVIDPTNDAIVARIDLGLAACGVGVVSPSASVIAFACGGMITGNTAIERSGIALVDVSSNQPKLLRTIGAAEMPAAMARSIGSVAFVSEEQVVITAIGSRSTPGDVIVRYHLEAKMAQVVTTSEKYFVLGGILCDTACEHICVAPNAERNVLMRWSIEDGGTLNELGEKPVPSGIGLPPRSVNFF